MLTIRGHLKMVAAGIVLMRSALFSGLDTWDCAITVAVGIVNGRAPGFVGIEQRAILSYTVLRPMTVVPKPMKKDIAKKYVQNSKQRLPQKPQPKLHERKR
jgi:hypothetical protein